MRVACWIPKATGINSEYVILIAFPLQQWFNERASILRSTHTASLFYYLDTILNNSRKYFKKIRSERERETRWYIRTDGRADTCDKHNGPFLLLRGTRLTTKPIVYKNIGLCRQHRSKSLFKIFSNSWREEFNKIVISVLFVWRTLWYGG